MRPLARRGAAVAALALAAATLNAPSAHAAPVRVSDGQAGTIEVWGASGAAPVRLTYGAARYVAVERGGASDSVTFGIGASGTVDAVEGSGVLVTGLPAALTSNAAGIDATTSAAVGWDRDGVAYVWGQRAPSIANLSGDRVEQMSLSTTWGLALKQDGSIEAFGTSGTGATVLPDQLTSPAADGFVRSTKVLTSPSGTFGAALRADGTVVAWGASAPTGLSGSSGISDVAVTNQHAVAVRADGSLEQWGGDGTKTSLPAGDDYVAVATTNSSAAATTTGGEIAAWIPNKVAVSDEVNVPVELQGRAGGGLGGANSTFFLVSAGPATGVSYRLDSAGVLTGTPYVGETLTGTSATFTGGAAVTQQWVADGEPIADATGATLEVSRELVGKQVAFRTEALLGGVRSTHTTAPVTVTAFGVAVAGSVTPSPAKVGDLLTGVPATFTRPDAQVSVRWTVDGEPVDGATGTTFALTREHVGKLVQFVTVGTWEGFEVQSAPGSFVESGDPLAVVEPGSISGTPKAGQRLVGRLARANALAATSAIAWLDSDGNVVATTANLVLTDDHVGETLVLRTTLRLGDEQVVDTSAPIGPIQPEDPLAVFRKGTVTGTAKVGQTLTGTAARFNTGAATVTRQWLADGEAIAGATGTTFVPTVAQVGKKIALRTTGALLGETATDVSAATANVAPATVPKASTSVAVSGATTAAYGSTVRWTVTVRGGSPAGGTVTVAGSGVNVRAAVSRGRAVVTLPRTLAPASRTLRVTYSGDGTHLASYRNLGLRVVKANVSAAAKVTKKPTSRKAGKVRVTVRGAGPVRAGGRVTVTIQKGSKRYTVRGNVRSNGTVDLTLRKLAKGTWTVKAVYAGDARYNARATGAVRVKVSK